ncbi:RpiB/LacA/LacB family sugar-phosphate isomerase, partial [Streptococcus suis]
MTIIIGADPAGSKLKDVIKDYLLEKSYDFKDVSDGSDFVDTTLAVVAEVNQEE